LTLADTIFYVFHEYFLVLSLMKVCYFHNLECHTKWYSVTPYDNVAMCQCKPCIILLIGEYWSLIWQGIFNHS